MVRRIACGTTITRLGKARHFIGWPANTVSRASYRSAPMAGTSPTDVPGQICLAPKTQNEVMTRVDSQRHSHTARSQKEAQPELTLVMQLIWLVSRFGGGGRLAVNRALRLMAKTQRPTSPRSKYGDAKALLCRFAHAVAVA